jgi:ubiquitin carboxyl-terminal hydrolase 34
MSRYPFGERFGDDLMVEDAFCEFFNAYTKLCSRLFLVDIHLLSQSSPEEPYLSPLISLRHLQHLLPIFRAEKSPVFHLLHKQYNTNTRNTNLRLHTEFVLSTGPTDLLRLTEEIFHRVPYGIRTNVAAYTAQILDCLGWFIFSSSRLTTAIDRAEFYRGVLLFFNRYSGDLQSPGQVTDAVLVKDLIQWYSVLIRNLCEWDKEIATHLVDDLMNFADPESPTTSAPAVIETVSDRSDYLRDPANLPALVSNAWKFRLLRKYIVKGRMELRVMSISLMDNTLVELYREHGSEDTSTDHPLLQYLADFLLRGRVVDYIISVDSHPQLISRSGNILGFLVVTHRWVDSQADAIWNTLTNSPDPRVVAATMTMLQSIVHLMDSTDLLYLCMKLHDLPLENYTVDILRLLRPLAQNLSKKASPAVYSTRSVNSWPWNVCIRMIRDTAPSRESTKHTVDLHAEATEQLKMLAAIVPAEDWHDIYRQCKLHIADRSKAATGSIRVIHILSSATLHADAPFLHDNSELSHHVFEELPSFVKAEKRNGAHPFQLKALSYRLELLTLLIHRFCPDVPVSLCNDVWDHVVGEHAFSNTARDLAWALFLGVVRASPTNGLCKSLISSYVPSLDPRFYTLGMFDFVANYNFPVIRKLLDTEHGGQTLLQIPGGALLWSFMLSAPDGTIEDRAAQLLAIRYVDVVERSDVGLAEVEFAHATLVEQCMQELRSAFQAARVPTTDHGLTSDSTDTEQTRRENETRFGRILLFQKQLLELVRRKPSFNRYKRADSKVETMENDIPGDSTIMLRYQCGSIKQSVAMAPDQSLADLYQKLCLETGFTKVNLFAKGKRVNVAEATNQKISDIDFGGQLLVQRADGAEITHPTSTSSANLSVYETTVAQHFDEMFAWMDSGDTTSRLVSDSGLRWHQG